MGLGHPSCSQPSFFLFGNFLVNVSSSGTYLYFHVGSIRNRQKNRQNDLFEKLVKSMELIEKRKKKIESQ
jgi:hypothetical protein